MAGNAILPSTSQGLRAWFKGTVEGRELLRELTEEAFEGRLEEKCRACQKLRPYPKVLVVLRRLGQFPGAEVYTEEGVTVRFLELPDVSSHLSLLEELIEVRLPRNWRHMVWLPAKRIHGEVFRGMSLAESLRHTERGVALKEIRTNLTEKKP